MFTLFKKNEAPQMALNAIAGHESWRFWGKVLTIVCCLPTCGFVLMSESNQDDWSGCCWATEVSYDSDAALAALKEALEALKVSSKNMPVEARHINKSEIAQWQVRQTLGILNAAISDGTIEKGYKTAITTVRDAIQEKARTITNSFAKKASLLGKFKAVTEQTPLSGHEYFVEMPETPNYFAGKRMIN